jgi:hypothetical protein
MAVWIDPLKDWGWRLGPSCHMTADTKEELVVFAVKIGLRRQWLQDDDRLWHFDLTASRRAAAVAAGAIECDFHEFFEHINSRTEDPLSLGLTDG